MKELQSKKMLYRMSVSKIKTFWKKALSEQKKTEQRVLQNKIFLLDFSCSTTFTAKLFEFSLIYGSDFGF